MHAETLAQKDCKDSFQVASRHRFLFQLGLPALLNL